MWQPLLEQAPNDRHRERTVGPSSTRTTADGVNKDHRTAFRNEFEMKPSAVSRRARDEPTVSAHSDRDGSWVASLRGLP